MSQSSDKIQLTWDETDDERRKRVDDILAKNSQPPLVCITCLELITDRQSAVITRHGPYHGAPFTCVEGRD